MVRAGMVLVCSCLLGFAPASAQELQTIQLPPPQTEIDFPLMRALQLRQSTRSFADRPLELQQLSNLLWAADGINRPESGKRTAPSAMSWHEIDIYVALPEAAYRYDPQAHGLLPVAAGDLRALTGGQAFVAGAPVNLVYVADAARQGRAADEDKRLYSWANTGFIAQNVYLYCAARGLAVVVRGSVDRPPLARALKLRPEQRIILAQTVGYPNQ